MGHRVVIVISGDAVKGAYDAALTGMIGQIENVHMVTRASIDAINAAVAAQAVRNA